MVNLAFNEEDNIAPLPSSKVELFKQCITTH